MLEIISNCNDMPKIIANPNFCTKGSFGRTSSTSRKPGMRRKPNVPNIYLKGVICIVARNNREKILNVIQSLFALSEVFIVNF